MDNRGKYLPLGTVVLLKGGKKEIMIMSYCIIPTGKLYDKNGEVSGTRMFDYGACAYPEGMISSDQLFAFNHEQIEKVCHLGYETEEYKRMSKFLLDHESERERIVNDVAAMKSKEKMSE